MYKCGYKSEYQPPFFIGQLICTPTKLVMDWIFAHVDFEH